MSRDVITLAQEARSWWSSQRGGEWGGLRLVMRKGGVRLLFGGLVIFGLLITAIFAARIAPYDPLAQNLREAVQGVSSRHLLGTDELGRDVLSRVIWGTRVSLLVGVVAVGLSMIVGTALGLVSGYVGGWVDAGVMRLVDIMLAFPALVLALAMAAVLGPGLTSVMIAVGVIGVPIFARLVRGEVLSVKERDFVLAARSVGTRPLHILLGHILSNVLGPIIVLASLRLGTAILAEASLSFLGMGLAPPTPTWGWMVSSGRTYLEVAPWLSVPAGALIFTTVMAFNILGDGIRDILDPRVYERG